MEKKRIIVPFERKSLGEKGEFEGYGSVFGNVDLGGDIVMKGAFADSLREYKETNELPLMPWFHKMELPIGDWLEMSEDEHGLKVKGCLWVGEENKTDGSQMVYNLLKGTGPKGMSIGYSVLEDSIEQIEVNGQKRTVRKLLRIKLWEVSIVPFGMNPLAKVTDAKSLLSNDGEIKDIRGFERVLRDAGISQSQAKAFISKCKVDRDGDLGGSEHREDETLLREILENSKKIHTTLQGK